MAALFKPSVFLTILASCLLDQYNAQLCDEQKHILKGWVTDVIASSCKYQTSNVVKELNVLKELKNPWSSCAQPKLTTAEGEVQREFDDFVLSTGDKQVILARAMAYAMMDFEYGTTKIRTPPTMGDAKARLLKAVIDRNAQQIANKEELVPGEVTDVLVERVGKLAKETVSPDDTKALGDAGLAKTKDDALVRAGELYDAKTANTQGTQTGASLTGTSKTCRSPTKMEKVKGVIAKLFSG